MAILLSPAIIGSGLWFAEDILQVNVPATPADFLIVLGGEWTARPAVAARLYQERLSSHVIISGEGDTERNRENLEIGGVPLAAIIMESASTNTWENAQCTAKILRARGAGSAVIVTSWQHTRRALSTFRTVAPEIRFTVVPVRRKWETFQMFWRYEAKYVLLEYVKVVWYRLRYNVPISVPDASPATEPAVPIPA